MRLFLLPLLLYSELSMGGTISLLPNLQAEVSSRVVESATVEELSKVRERGDQLRPFVLACQRELKKDLVPHNCLQLHRWELGRLILGKGLGSHYLDTLSRKCAIKVGQIKNLNLLESLLGSVSIKNLCHEKLVERLRILQYKSLDI